MAVERITQKECCRRRGDAGKRQADLPQGAQDGTADGLRQWAEVGFVSGQPKATKQSQPLCDVGLRLLKAQGVLIAEGSDRHHYAVIANLNWAGGQVAGAAL